MLEQVFHSACPGLALFALFAAGGLVGYKMQSVVDVDTPQIVAYEVSSVGTDRRRLTRMARWAKRVLQAGQIKVLADRGYDKGEELRAC
jgi:hypothetical protein